MVLAMPLARFYQKVRAAAEEAAGRERREWQRSAYVAYTVARTLGGLDVTFGAFLRRMGLSDDQTAGADRETAMETLLRMREKLRRAADRRRERASRQHG